ncbi:MAG: acetyltransferase [Gemmatimonadales bacterium]|nr:MAG: acetyltransferase [Gemmatimonadales bacterium]
MNHESSKNENALYILGSRGHGSEVLEAARAASASESSGDRLVVEGFLDDDPALMGTEVQGSRVLGPLDDPRLEGANAALGVGYPQTKLRVVSRVKSLRPRWPTIVHPASTVASMTGLGGGVLVQAGAVLSTNIALGDFTTVNLAATLSHDVVVEPFATVSPGAHVGGNVRIGEGAFIGIGASVVQGTTIGAWSVVGAGAVVVHDVEPNTVVAGVPARIISRRSEGWQHG